MDVFWEIFWRYRGALLNGMLLTAEISLLAIIGSLAIGVLVGCLLDREGFFIRRATRLYVEVFRNTPCVVKVFCLYYVVGLDAFPSALIGLATHQSSYMADVVASGLRAIPKEQSESSRVLGHTGFQLYWYILLPQTARIIAPPMNSQFIEVLKNSSIAMLVGLEELTFRTNQIEIDTGRGYMAAAVVTGMYLVIAVAISGSVSFLQHRFGAAK